MSIIEKIKPICRMSDIVDISLIGNKDVFVVRDADDVKEALVYTNDGFNNSDRVRAHFAKTQGVKFTSTRCCRLKNA